MLDDRAAASAGNKEAARTVGRMTHSSVSRIPTVYNPTSSVEPMAANMTGLKIQLAIAGTTIEKGTSLHAHMVIGTPGKVVDWLKRRVINSKTINVFVLDEADNMVGEDGHRANSLLIKKTLTRNCQCLLFSATFPTEVVKFADKMIHNADKILIESDESLVRI